MTSSGRPDAATYLWTVLQGGEPAVILKVRCGRCKRTPGRVVRTPAGLMWLGYLRNPLAGRLQGGEDSYWPAWLDMRLTVYGECRCYRPTGATQPGWPEAVPVSHGLRTADLMAAIRAGRRVLAVGG